MASCCGLNDAASLPTPTVLVYHSAASSVAYVGCYSPRKGAETPGRVTHTSDCHGEPLSFFFLCLYLKLIFVGDENAFNKQHYQLGAEHSDACEESEEQSKAHLELLRG